MTGGGADAGAGDVSNAGANAGAGDVSSSTSGAVTGDVAAAAAAGPTETRLRAIRHDALALAEQLEHDMVAVSEARDSSNVDDEHDPEGSTIAFERSQLAAVRDSAAARARDADDALERLGAGTYGICLNCGRPIAPARLDARPMAGLCIDCAS
ncbi:TraR/DksA family transcriptional regulator [Frondihabitans cladoniiphilus]|uniref:Zinc finger DksA/TraR C4-type domain-containing protein n=1 Tax=Frondihabitans cladoniiphilus TaxID=715785 RepID=A0ABP8VL39_9MICO